MLPYYAGQPVWYRLGPNLLRSASWLAAIAGLASRLQSIAVFFRQRPATTPRGVSEASPPPAPFLLVIGVWGLCFWGDPPLGAEGCTAALGPEGSTVALQY